MAYLTIQGASVEVFFSTGNTDACAEPGWYWWSCQPGCLPDGDAMGPFSSEGDAARDALGGFEEDDIGF